MLFAFSLMLVKKEEQNKKKLAYAISAYAIRHVENMPPILQP